MNQGGGDFFATPLEDILGGNEQSIDIPQRALLARTCSWQAAALLLDLGYDIEEKSDWEGLATQVTALTACVLMYCNWSSQIDMLHGLFEDSWNWIGDQHVAAPKLVGKFSFLLDQGASVENLFACAPYIPCRFAEILLERGLISDVHTLLPRLLPVNLPKDSPLFNALTERRDMCDLLTRVGGLKKLPRSYMLLLRDSCPSSQPAVIPLVQSLFSWQLLNFYATNTDVWLYMYMCLTPSSYLVNGGQKHITFRFGWRGRTFPHVFSYLSKVVRRRIMTALLCWNRVANLPSDIRLKILGMCADDDDDDDDDNGVVAKARE